MKQIEITAREEQLLRSALYAAAAEKSKLVNSDDPGIARIGARVMQELTDLLDKIGMEPQGHPLNAYQPFINR